MAKTVAKLDGDVTTFDVLEPCAFSWRRRERENACSAIATWSSASGEIWGDVGAIFAASSTADCEWPTT